MTIQELEQKNELLRKLRWLEDIRLAYGQMLERIRRNTKDGVCSFTIEGIDYSDCGDGRTFNLNPHRTIDPRHIADGLDEAIKALDAEIAALTATIEDRTPSREQYIKRTAELLHETGTACVSTDDGGICHIDYFNGTLAEAEASVRRALAGERGEQVVNEPRPLKGLSRLAAWWLFRKHKKV